MSRGFSAVSITGEPRCFQSPSRYIQGPGTINYLYETVAIWGSRAFAVIDSFLYEDLKPRLEKQFADQSMSVVCAKYEGEINQANLDRMNEKVQGLGYVPDFIIGIGGGKSCDMAKAIATDFNTKDIICPTALSSDAPTSGHSILYNEDGSHYLKYHRRNPDYVIVDTELAIKAPPFTFSSGLGDAMATYFEGVAAMTRRDNCGAGGGKYASTEAGRAIARLAYDILLKYGRQGYQDARAHRLSVAFEECAEANTLLSGVGFENTRCALSHGIQGIFYKLPTRPLLHGEQVGFSLLAELLIEANAGVEGRMEDFEEIYAWNKDVGLPVCLADLGITENADEIIELMAESCVAESALMKNEPFEVTKEMVAAALKQLEAYHAAR